MKALSFLLLVVVVAGAGFAAEKSPAVPEAPRNPPDLFALPAHVRPLRVAIYEGPGSGEEGVKAVSDGARRIPGTNVTRIKAAEMGTYDLSGFDVVVFSGGSGSGQSKAIGEAGRKNVREFVARGGGYLGICAGAYLACAGFDWGLGILNARTVSNKWRRGRGMMRVQLTEEGQGVFGARSEPFTIRYANGPIIQPLGRGELPTYRVAAVFRTEIAQNDTPVGVMIDSPAAVYSTFGQGRVFTISPHAEDTPGLENFVPRALAWLAERK